MGQYYTPVFNITDKTKMRVFDSHFIDENGKKDYMPAKLTEHSWIANPWVTGILTQLLDNPQKVWWVGDYSEEYKEYSVNEQLAFVLDVKDNITPENVENLYLVNYDKKLSLSLGDFIKRNNQDGWCSHPLPLLTACGNGCGGGDFYGPIGRDFVGRWKGDTIGCVSLEDKPEDFKDVMYIFK